MRLSVAGLLRPLNCVSQICDGDNEVTFTKEGGWIRNQQTGHITKFPRVRGVYELSFWIPKSLHSGNEKVFTRQED